MIGNQYINGIAPIRGDVLSKKGPSDKVSLVRIELVTL
jgi:hypothetical protein